MQHATCVCGNRLFFENTACLACGRTLGFVPETVRLHPLEPLGNHWHPADSDGHTPLRQCENRHTAAACNWMLPADAHGRLCRACRLSRVIPDQAVPGNQRRWHTMERAKRHLVYGLLRLHLPVEDRDSTGNPALAFDFKEDTADGTQVLTGHAGGVITINIAEADDDRRESMRLAMGEPYRTVLGHLRHESGHYYWERLVRGTGWHQGFRERFGDETADYAAALRRHHQTPDEHWRDHYISAYASAHPWEDWAETWAHYLHLRDTLETAADLGLMVAEAEKYRRFRASNTDFRQLLGEWMRLTVIMNSLARSVGAPDTYPFSLNPAVCSKLEFIHGAVHAAGMED